MNSMKILIQLSTKENEDLINWLVFFGRVESLFYTIGAYLHELGHLFGLDHGNNQYQTIMSSSKGYIDSGKEFFLISSHLYSIIFNQQCSCYKVELEKIFNINFLFLFLKEPILNISCSYSNGLFNKQSIHLKSSCKSGEINRRIFIK
jgi:hypothetical protein